MSFEFIQRKQALLSELMDALATIEKVLPELSADERLELSEGLDKLLNPPRPKVQHTLGELPDVFGPIRSESKQTCPPPARAVELLLQESPVGLYAGDIISALKGKIQTSSKSESDVIYSAIAFLKKKGVITQTEDKRYFIAKIREEEASLLS